MLLNRVSAPSLRRLCASSIPRTSPRALSFISTRSIFVSPLAMSKQSINSPQLPTPIAPYSPAIAANGFVYLSGQVGLTNDGKLLDGLEAQTNQVFTNIRLLLDASGCSMKDVVKTTVFLTSMSDYAAMNAIYEKAFADAKPYPARSAVAVAGLPRGALVEIEVIAVKPK